MPHNLDITQNKLIEWSQLKVVSATKMQPYPYKEKKDKVDVQKDDMTDNKANQRLLYFTIMSVTS